MTTTAYPSHLSLVSSTSRMAIRPQYTSRRSSTAAAPPSYSLRDANRPPPYFPPTPLEPWLATIRQKHWERTDLDAFSAHDAVPWREEHATLCAQLHEWGLPADPNENIREAVRDPFGWCGVTPRDVRFVEGAFPSYLQSTVLGLRPREHASLLNDNIVFSPALLAAINETVALGVYPHAHEWRPLRYHVPPTTADPTDDGTYRADWMLACIGWTLPATLGGLLITQHDYTRLVKALFLVQARRKWAADARALLAARQRNPLYRWQHGRRSRQQSLDNGAAPAGTGWLPSSFSRGSFGSLLALTSSTTIAPVA